MIGRLAAILCIAGHGLLAAGRAPCGVCPTSTPRPATVRSAAPKQVKRCCCSCAQRAQCQPAPRTDRGAERPTPKQCQVCRCRRAQEPFVPPKSSPSEVSSSLKPVAFAGCYVATAAAADVKPTPVRFGLDPPCLTNTHNDRQALIDTWLK